MKWQADKQKFQIPYLPFLPINCARTPIAYIGLPPTPEHIYIM